MKNKVIAVDLDGTLIRSDCMPSDFTVDVVKQLKKEGYTIVITTGRSWVGAHKIYQKLDLNTPIVLLNGSMIYNPITDKVYMDHRSPKEFVYDLITRPLFYKFVNEAILNNKNHTIKNYQFRDFVLENETKISFVSLDERYTNSDKSYEKKCFVNYSKADGIKMVLNLLNKSVDDLVFIGDGDNDLEIMKIAKIGVAMANAVDVLKENACRITDFDNEHDGCIKYILRLILESKNCLVIKHNVKGRKFKKLLNYLLNKCDSFSWKYPICDYILPEEAHEITTKQISMLRQSKDLLHKLKDDDRRKKVLSNIFSQPIDENVFENAIKEKISYYNQKIVHSATKIPQDFVRRSYAHRVTGTFLKEYFFLNNKENVTDLLCVSQLQSGLTIDKNVIMKSMSFYRKEQLILEVIAEINMARIFLYDDELEEFEKTVKLKMVSVDEV